MKYGATVQDTIGYLDEGQRRMEAWKRRSFEHLGIRPGHRLLDVGCGTGEDVLALAEQVGSEGEVVGLDNDLDMIAEARGRAGRTDLPVRFVMGDVYVLPFEDGSFDACRAERVFQHLSRPTEALAEMRRVTRPSGRVSIFDVDWDTLTVSSSYPDITRKVVHHCADQHGCGLIGRMLYGLFRRVDFADIKCEMMCDFLAGWETSNWLLGHELHAGGACAAGLLSNEERDRWLEDLRARGAAGTFFASITFFLVSGTWKG